MMRRAIWGAVLFGALCACGEKEQGPSSTVSQPMGGSAGSGGEGGLDLGLGAGKGGGGAGGTAGASGGTAGAATAGAGSSGGGAGGTSGGGGGSGGTKPAGMCTRAAGSDLDCADFWSEEGYTQAYACPDLSAAVQLPRTLDKECASVNFVSGAAYGACCLPVP